MQPALAGFSNNFSGEWKDKGNLRGCVNTGLDASLPPLHLVKSLKPGKWERKILPVKSNKYSNLFSTGPDDQNRNKTVAVPLHP